MPVRTGVNIRALLLSKRKQYAKVQFRFPCRVENNDKAHLTWQGWVLPPLWEWLLCAWFSCLLLKFGVWHLMLGLAWGGGALDAFAGSSRCQLSQLVASLDLATEFFSSKCCAPCNANGGSWSCSKLCPAKPPCSHLCTPSLPSVQTSVGCKRG